MFKRKSLRVVFLIALLILTIALVNIDRINYSSKDREDIQERYKWDLSSIFATHGDWVEEFNRFKSELNSFDLYGLRPEESSKDLLDMMIFKEELSKGVERVYLYALLKSDGDTGNNHYQTLLFKAERLRGILDNVLSLITLEIANISEERLEELLKEESELKVYKEYLLGIIRGGGFLTPKEERIISLAGGMASGPSHIFRMINYADYNGGLNKNTRAAILRAKVEADIFYMRARGYPTVRESRGVPIGAYDSLIELVRSNLSALHRYRSIGGGNLFTPLSYKNISYEDAQRIILEALKPLGEDYIEVVERAFEDRWIDLYPNKGKRKGAYQVSIYGGNSYISTNYSGDLNGLFTLAHELGHGVHSYYSSQNQPYLYSRSSIVFAEVASSVNQILLINHLLDNADSKGEYSYLLRFYLQEFESTLYFQTMLAEFERDIYKTAQEGEVLTADILSNSYKELSREYFGIGEGDYWARIPHFYESTFYVYQYAISFPTAIGLAYNILEGNDGSLDNYTKFLKSGGLEESPYILKEAGSDIMDEKTIKRSLAHFNNLLKEYERLQKQRKISLISFIVAFFIVMVLLSISYSLWRYYLK